MGRKGVVFEYGLSLLALARVSFSTRRDTGLELLGLRQQVGVLERKRPFWDRSELRPNRFPTTRVRRPGRFSAARNCKPDLRTALAGAGSKKG